jgi:hypothetical protein
MLYEFVDQFKNIKVGDKIKIKNKYLCPSAKGFSASSSYVRWNFQIYVDLNSNKFTVTDIQEIDKDNAMIIVCETHGSLEYLQVEPFLFKGTVRVINC